MMHDIEDIKSMIEHLTDKLDSIVDYINDKCDTINEDNQNIYEMEHQKLMKFLDNKFYKFEQKFNALLRAPKFSNKLEVYDLASTSSTSTTEMCTSIQNEILYEIIEDKDEIYTDEGMFYDEEEFACGDIYTGVDIV